MYNFLIYFLVVYKETVLLLQTIAFNVIHNYSIPQFKFYELNKLILKLQRKCYFIYSQRHCVENTWNSLQVRNLKTYLQEWSSFKSGIFRTRSRSANCTTIIIGIRKILAVWVKYIPKPSGFLWHVFSRRLLIFDYRKYLLLAEKYNFIWRDKSKKCKWDGKCNFLLCLKATNWCLLKGVQNKFPPHLIFWDVISCLYACRMFHRPNPKLWGNKILRDRAFQSA
jgi:hypothetical protein